MAAGGGGAGGGGSIFSAHAARRRIAETLANFALVVGFSIVVALHYAQGPLARRCAVQGSTPHPVHFSQLL